MTAEPDRRPIAARRLRISALAADWLVRRGASANAISLAGMAAGLGAGLAFAATAAVTPGWARVAWLAGAALVQARLVANLLDGMVAIGRGIASPVGELFNEVPDRVSDTAVLAGLGVAAGQPSLGLLAALAAMATAYIRAVGKAAGAGSEFCGPMAKQQRMALATALGVAAAVLPAAWTLGWAAAALWVVAAGSLLTAARRLRRIAGALRVPVLQP